MIDQIRTFLLPVLKILSSPEYQQRVWIDRDGPEVYSYIECIDDFLQITDDIFDNGDMQEGISDTALQNLKTLLNDIKAFHKSIKGWDKQNVQLILSDPKWHAIQKRSNELYKVLNQL